MTDHTPEMPPVRQIQAPEAVRGTPAPYQDAAPGTVVYADPTQVRRPWHATARTIFQAALALLTLVPLVLGEVYADVDAAPAAVVQVLAVTATVARIMALPGVERFLQNYLPFLAAGAKPTV